MDKNNLNNKIPNNLNDKELNEGKKTKISLFQKTIKAFKSFGRPKYETEGSDRKKSKSTKIPEKSLKDNKNNSFLKKTTTVGKRKFENLIQKTEEGNEDENNLTENNDNPRNNNDKINSALTNKLSLEKKAKTIKTIKNEDIFLEPTNYENYLSEISLKGKKAPHRETFCEGFFIASFPQKDGHVVEKSQSFPASCGHKECSSLPAMKPEIILRYPLEDTKTLELNNLAATICFPTGIKVCYSEEEPQMIKDYVTPITNQKGERYYMMTYHFYLKMENDIYAKNYEMHPLKHHLMKFADDYLNMKEDDINKEMTEQIQEDLAQAQDLASKDIVYIPYCICLISKYPYVLQMKKCLQTIYSLIIINHGIFKEKCKLNHLIMHIINSVPIPDIHNRVLFYIPYFAEGIEIKCPKLNDLKIMNTRISDLLKLFSIDYIVMIFRFLIFEKKILFIDDDYTRLSTVSDNFISLLYPFQWMHTYIPIMSDQMLNYLETFLPFLNGINSSLIPLVKELFQTGDMEENDEMLLIYIKESKFRLGSTLVGKNIKKYKYVEENVPALPSHLEKELKNKIKKIKQEIEDYQKNYPNITDLSEFDLKIRNAFIEMFVEMFHDIDKYMCFLDEDVVFNKNLFMESIPKEDKKFYDEFIDTQLFQLFCQNIVKDELNYFKSKMNEFNQNKSFSNEQQDLDTKKFFSKKIYVIMPDYLDIKEKDKDDIEDKINENFVLKEETDVDGIIRNERRITEYIQKINNNNYNIKNWNIYLIPKKDKTSENTENKFASFSELLTKKKSGQMEFKQLVMLLKAKTNKSEMDEKEEDSIKEKIKDFTVKIFKSEDIETDTNLKKDLQNDLNTYVGREFFVNFLSKNTTNIILLKDNSFHLLGTLIYNTLLYMLQIEENIKNLEQIVVLIKSLRYFAKEEKEKVGKFFLAEEKKSVITLWTIYKQKLQVYPKASQSNLWTKWYKIDLNLEKEKENKETKKRIIINLCDLMMELELNKPFIKNTLKGILNNVFEKDEEIIKNILEVIKQKIINSKYVCKPIHM